MTSAASDQCEISLSQRRRAASQRVRDARDRLTSARYELNEEAVPLALLVEDCHHLLKLRAHQPQPENPRGVRARSAARVGRRARHSPDLPQSFVERDQVTPQGGDVWIKVSWTESGGQYFSVKDTGPGIPEDEIPVVLASFGRGSNAIKSAEQDTGLGLPIAKSLVDLHGGTFTLKSKLRVGTEVIVALPPERVMSALAPIEEPAPTLQPKEAKDEIPVAPFEERPGSRKKSLFLLRGG